LIYCFVWLLHRAPLSLGLKPMAGTGYI